MKKILGKRLADARKKNGLTQAAVASKLDIESNTVSGYESGYRSPSAEILLKLAELYNVPVDYLLGRIYTGNGFADFHTVLKETYGTVGLKILDLLNTLEEKEQYRVLGYIEKIIEQKETDH